MKTYRVSWKYATRSMISGDTPWQSIVSNTIKISNADSAEMAINFFKKYLSSEGGEPFSLDRKNDSIVFFNQRRELLLVWYDFKAWRAR